jgi:hypothetical protein
MKVNNNHLNILFLSPRQKPHFQIGELENIPLVFFLADGERGGGGDKQICSRGAEMLNVKTGGTHSCNGTTKSDATHFLGCKFLCFML